MWNQRVRRAALVTLVAISTTVSAATIQGIDAAGVGMGGIAVFGPDIVARRAWISDPSGNGDGMANPGEQVVLNVRLRNSGISGATNARVTVSTDDPAVDMSTYTARRSTWPVDDPASYAWGASISPAAAPHDVTVIATVTADNGGPWLFVITFAIAPTPVDFARVDGWITDPAPEGDSDGQAEPGERLHIGSRFRHEGTTDATGVRVTLQSLDSDLSVVVGSATHADWPAGEERDTAFVVDVASTASTRDVPVFITVETDGEDPWQFSMSIRIMGQDPDFEFRSFWLFDPEPGGNRDGLATPGERLLPRIRLRNVGAGDGKDVRVTLSSLDAGVRITSASVTHATWPAGAARNSLGLAMDVYPFASAHTATLVATVVTADGGEWEFPITLDIGAPTMVIEHRRSWLYDPEPGGNRDGIASRGERVLPRVRLRQAGPSTAHNVTVTLEVDDPDVSVTGRPTTYDVWNPGSARTLTSFGVEIARDAAPHDVAAVIRVSADSGGSWEFPFVFPIAYRPAEFVQRSGWVFDPTPGGDRDGQAEAGERVLPRIRLRHVGAEDAAVTVRLTTSDPDVTIVAGEVAHDTWPAGTARNNVGFVVDISPFAAPHDVDFVVTTDAGGDTQQFQYTIAIAGPLAKLVVAEASLLDTIGDRDRIIEPGEYVSASIRVVNVGSSPIVGLRGTLVATDADIRIMTETADHAALGPGDALWVTTLTARILNAAIPRELSLVVVFTSDNAEPIRVELPMPLGRDIGMRVQGLAYSDAGEGATAMAKPTQERPAAFPCRFLT